MCAVQEMRRSCMRTRLVRGGGGGDPEQLVATKPKSVSHSKKGGQRESSVPGGVWCEDKALGKATPNNSNNHTCPTYQHSPGRAERNNPKQTRKAAQTSQPSRNQK